MMVDDAHASGVLGRNGRGSVDHFGLHGKVDVQVVRCQRPSAAWAVMFAGAAI